MKKEIFLIDDDYISNFTITRILSKILDFPTISCFPNFLGAISNLEKNISEGKAFPSHIFIDLGRSSSAGKEFLEQFEKLDYSELLKPQIFFITSSILGAWKSEGKFPGRVSEILVKPINADTIKNIFTIDQ